MFRAIFVALALLAAPPAFAETGLGHAGQVTVSSDLALGAGFSWVSGAGTSSRWGLGAGSDYFVRDDFTVGAALNLRSEKYDDTPSRLTASGRARLGWYRGLNPLAGLWVRGSVGASHASAGNGQGASTGIDAVVEAIFTMTPMDHLFLGLGPTFRRDLANWRDGAGIGGRLNSVGVNLFVGAFF